MDLGKFLQRDLLLRTTVTMIKTQAHLPEICKTRDQCSLKKKMLTNTETLRSFSSIEPTVTGKLRLFYLLTLSWTTVLKVSLMVNHLALNALVTSAIHALNLWSILKLMMLTLAVMTAKSTAHGLRVSTLESIEIKLSSTP